MQLSKIIGENIVRRRKNLGISQRVLAERLGVSQTSMNQIEKGVTVPKFHRLEVLARTLQCSVSSLFRPYTITEDTKNRVEIITDIMSQLPEDLQDSVVNLIVKIVDTAQQIIDKQLSE